MADLNSLIESEVIVNPNPDEEYKEPADEDYGDLALLEEHKHDLPKIEVQQEEDQTPKSMEVDNSVIGSTHNVHGNAAH